MCPVRPGALSVHSISADLQSHVPCPPWGTLRTLNISRAICPVCPGALLVHSISAEQCALSALGHSQCIQYQQICRVMSPTRPRALSVLSISVWVCGLCALPGLGHCLKTKYKKSCVTCLHQGTLKSAPGALQKATTVPCLSWGVPAPSVLGHVCRLFSSTPFLG